MARAAKRRSGNQGKGTRGGKGHGNGTAGRGGARSAGAGRRGTAGGWGRCLLGRACEVEARIWPWFPLRLLMYNALLRQYSVLGGNILFVHSVYVETCYCPTSPCRRPSARCPPCPPAPLAPWPWPTPAHRPSHQHTRTRQRYRGHLRHRTPALPTPPTATPVPAPASAPLPPTRAAAPEAPPPSAPTSRNPPPTPPHTGCCYAVACEQLRAVWRHWRSSTWELWDNLHGRTEQAERTTQRAQDVLSPQQRVIPVRHWRCVSSSASFGR